MRKIQLLGILLLAFIAGCSTPATEKNAPEAPKEVAKKASEKAPPEIVQPEAQEVLAGKIECKPLTEPDAMPPRYEVAVVIGQDRHVFGEVVRCVEMGIEEYEENEVPSEAVSAAGGWYAGGGDYFYLLLEGNEYVLMQGWQDEGQQDDGFHYKEAARYPAL